MRGVPGKEGHNRILQVFIPIGEEMYPPAEQIVVKQKRQHEPQYLPDAAHAKGKALRALLQARDGIGYFGAFNSAVRHRGALLGERRRGRWALSLRLLLPHLQTQRLFAKLFSFVPLRGPEPREKVYLSTGHPPRLVHHLIQREIKASDFGSLFSIAMTMTSQFQFYRPQYCELPRPNVARGLARYKISI
jgi:hypothetical protein